MILAFSSVDGEQSSVAEHRVPRRPPYTRLPLWRDSQQLLVSVEQAAREFSRHHKYTVGGDLRRLAMEVCRLVARAARTGEARSSPRLPGCEVGDGEASSRVGDDLASQGGAGAVRSTKVRSRPNTVRLSPFALSEAKGLMCGQTLRFAQGKRVGSFSEQSWVKLGSTGRSRPSEVTGCNA